MTIQDQCCTKDQGKRLQELGITAESYFLHGKTSTEYPLELWLVEGSEDTFYPAYTSAELSMMLPPGYQTWCHFNTKHWHVGRIKKGGQIYPYQIEDTEVQARAAMLIHLLENNHITADQVNESFKK